MVCFRALVGILTLSLLCGVITIYWIYLGTCCWSNCRVFCVLVSAYTLFPSFSNWDSILCKYFIIMVSLPTHVLSIDPTLTGIFRINHTIY